jgi:hypothetical protein
MSDDEHRASTSEPPPAARTADDATIFERVVPDGIKRKIGAGVENMLKEGRLKNLKLPRELMQYIMSQVDETKHAALAAIAKEMRLFLEQTDIAEELSKVLSKVSLEVKTEVRFKPIDEEPAKGTEEP